MKNDRICIGKLPQTYPKRASKVVQKTILGPRWATLEGEEPISPVSRHNATNLQKLFTMPSKIETVTGEIITHWVDVAKFSRYVVVKMNMDENSADDIDEAQAEELAADDLAPCETRGHKRGRRGTAITRLMREIDNLKRYGSASEPP